MTKALLFIHIRNSLSVCAEIPSEKDQQKLEITFSSFYVRTYHFCVSHTMNGCVIIPTVIGCNNFLCFTCPTKCTWYSPNVRSVGDVSDRSVGCTFST